MIFDIEEKNSSDIVFLSGLFQLIDYNFVMENVGDMDGFSVRDKWEKKWNGLVNQIKWFVGKLVWLNWLKLMIGQVLKGFMFISKFDGGDGWIVVEERFEMIMKIIEGLLIRLKFGECIGKNLYVKLRSCIV